MNSVEALAEIHRTRAERIFWPARHDIWQLAAIFGQFPGDLVHGATQTPALPVHVGLQVADLGGARRGHVSIACSQAVNPIFL